MEAFVCVSSLCIPGACLEGKLNEGAGRAAVGSPWVEGTPWELSPHSMSEQKRLSLVGGAVGPVGIQGRPHHFCPLVPSSSLSSGQAALSMTTGLSFRLDRSGLLVIPVSYASAR